jgi:PAS domain-containing protein
VSSQKPIELILARNLLSSLTTPAFLVDERGSLVFFNDAAGALVGRRFEETGQMEAAEWAAEFGPVDDGDAPIAWDALPLTAALQGGKATHTQMRLRVADGSVQHIEVSALPIVATGGSRGAMAIFWPAGEEDGQG